MTRSLHQYELPVRFIERFRPVKTQPREKGLPLYLFDAYGLSFYRRMTTAGAIPPEAIWSIIPSAGNAGLQLIHGHADTPLGYIVAQVVPANSDPAGYALPIRLGYRAKVAVQALQRLRHDLASSCQTATADVLAVIDQRIDAYYHPAS